MSHSCALPAPAVGGGGGAMRRLRARRVRDSAGGKAEGRNGGAENGTATCWLAGGGGGRRPRAGPRADGRTATASPRRGGVAPFCSSGPAHQNQAGPSCESPTNLKVIMGVKASNGNHGRSGGLRLGRGGRDACR